jgi:hypothetical protein
VPEVIDAVYLVCRHLEMGMNARETLKQRGAPKACFCVARRELVVEKLDGVCGEVGGSSWARLNAVCEEVGCPL